MSDIRKVSSYTGRANTVLTFGHGDSAKAVITMIVAHVRDEDRGGRIRFVGPVAFEKKTTQHILEVVLSATDSILKGLNLPKKSFDISVVNPDATAIMDIGSNIYGFSADLPVLLAILSASLQMTVPEDIVSTGHVASPDGDIRMVKSIPAKLEVVLKAKSIRRFVHPAIEEEAPLDSFPRGERQSASDALTRAKRDILTIAVHDTGELVREIFSDEQTVLASLNNGFYMVPAPSTAQTGNTKAIQFLTQNEKGVWTVLERQLLQARNDDAKDILLAFAQYHIDRKTYPKGLGRRLLRLIQSLPPQTRRKLEFPLLPTSECIQLSQFAKDSEADREDVPFLFQTGSDERVRLSTKDDDQTVPKEIKDLDYEKTLQDFLSRISAKTRTSLINGPIDTARAVYLPGSVTVKSAEEFNETIISFYVHLLRHTRKASEPDALEEAARDALPLLEETYLKRGGYRAALAEATSGVQGGLRVILDMMTEQYKHKEQEKYVYSVFKTEFETLEDKDKVGLMGALMKRLEPHLGPEISSQPPERFVIHYEIIIKAYLQSMDRMNLLFDSF